jgi:hypothetical protein
VPLDPRSAQPAQLEATGTSYAKALAALSREAHTAGLMFTSDPVVVLRVEVSTPAHLATARRPIGGA